MSTRGMGVALQMIVAAFRGQRRMSMLRVLVMCCSGVAIRQGHAWVASSTPIYRKKFKLSVPLW